VYVTKAKHKNDYLFGELDLSDDYKNIVYGDKWLALTRDKLNGKVVARFWFDEYVKYVDCSDCSNNENGYECENDFMYLLSVDPILRKETCLTSDEIEDYGNGKDLYAWHIKNIEIFSKVKRLEDYNVKRAPQSWCYIYE
jgi:hypothetical protein